MKVVESATYQGRKLSKQEKKLHQKQSGSLYWKESLMKGTAMLSRKDLFWSSSAPRVGLLQNFEQRI